MPKVKTKMGSKIFRPGPLADQIETETYATMTKRSFKSNKQKGQDSEVITYSFVFCLTLPLICFSLSLLMEPFPVILFVKVKNYLLKLQ